MERLSSSFVEFSEKFYVLETAGVDICAKKVNAQVKCVAGYKYQDKDDGSQNAASGHASHLIDNGSDNACGEA